MGLSIDRPAEPGREPPARRVISRVLSSLRPLWAVLAAFAVAAILIAGVGINPWVAFLALVKGAAGSAWNLGITIQKTIPLLLAGLGVAVAFRCGVFNIGAEGQLYMGALAATVVAFLWPDLSPWLHVPLCLLAGFLGGALWALVPGLLKVRYGISEIITTIMFNYIGVLVVSMMVNGPLKEDADYSPQTNVIPASSKLPMLWPEARVHLGIVIALLAVLAIFLLLKYTSLGFQMRATGSNKAAARFVGIQPLKAMALAMLISGGLAGLAGTCDVLGAQYRLSDTFSPGYGYDAIGVALLFTGHPLGVTGAALFFGGLRTGLNAVQRSVGLPNALAQVIQGIAILFVIASRGIPAWKGRRPRLGRRRSTHG